VAHVAPFWWTDLTAEAGEIEAWGRGIQRIFDACREAETPNLRVLYDLGEIWFEFPYSDAYLDVIPGGRGAGGTGERRVGETPVKTHGKSPERILAALGTNPDWTLAQVAEGIGMSLRTVERAVRKLVTAGRLQHVGSRKAGHWEVLK
jgi:ATP-dependent DNA helicase RecG